MLHSACDRNMLTLEGNMVMNNGIFRRRIEINDSGRIQTIGEPKGVADFVFKEELVFPGFIDVHVHAREDTTHADDHKEDFRSASAAAIRGGVTAFAEMPNNPMPPVDDVGYVAKEKLARNAAVDVVLYAGIGPLTRPLSRKVPYKAFMGKSVGELFFDRRDKLESALKNYVGQHVSFHCEDPETLARHTGAQTHELKRPAEAEVSGIRFVLELMERYDIYGKICHVSTHAGAEEIVRAKKRGVRVTAEVAPHHLYFSSITASGNTLLQVNPPVRTEQDRVAILAMLREGNLDCLATDHAPHTLTEKGKGVSGMPHLDTYGPFASWLMKENGFRPEDIARVASYNPGAFLSEFLEEKYGMIEEGYVGSLTVLDMDKPVTIAREALRTKCGWSPFEGITFPGSVSMTIIKGKAYKNE